MRIPSTLLASRLPQRENEVPFQEILPLRLKNRVSGKGDSQKDIACVHEMTLVFACLKANEFGDGLCNKEITALQNCYKNFLTQKADLKKSEGEGKLEPGNRLNYRQLNKYLRRFPNQ